MQRPEPSASESVRAEVAADLFPFLRMAYTVAGAVAFAGVLLTEVPAGRVTPSLWLQAGALAGSIGAIWLPLKRSVAAVVVIAGLLVVGLVALLRYGPLGGAALILVGAAYVAAVNVGRQGAIATGAIGLAVYVLAAVLVLTGTTPAPDPAGYGPERASTWMRAGTSIVAIAAGLVYLFERFVGALERLAEKIATSRLALEASERERERALAALAESQRLASLGRLAAGAAHDFRNALTVILTGIAELKDDRSEPHREELLRDVERAAHGAEATARHLVAFGRPGVSGGETCDPSQVVDGVARTLGRVLPREIAVSAETSQAGLVGLDGPSLSQAILNLALNARDAMPSGGRLDLRVLAEGEGFAVEVADNGVGMAPETLARAAEPYFTTKGPSGGAGLGLAMVRDVAERAGGRIEIVSRRGKGTSVRLWLPRASASPRPGAAASSG